ncbi:SDR family oxidoreductase [Roseiterribacter gracilis]|uniref:Saccharopine dehydrogenase n=1 Tax=Roseiterribacter gracilis TaxID=2812848 RepID=A0A8S8XAS7_9PROT|nr:hypothetical protein TMPK1_04930 [Rhodospirillales bacterium TMPK1]
MKLLIVGGYGIFGSRIVELLQDEPRLTILVAGRSLPKARAACAGFKQAQATLVAAQFDRDGDVALQLAALQPDLLIDASGPFQTYGEARYRVVEACLAQRVQYLDLADGADFVAGIADFDAAARAAGVYVLSGVSSFPVLSAAVVRHLAKDLVRVDAIRGGIAPSPFAGVGENVIRAIASYAGQAITLRRDGHETTAYPFTEQMRFTIAPPGRLPLHSRLFSLVDAPEPHVLPQVRTEVDTIWMGAAPVPELLHRALIALAWLVRWNVLRSVLPIAGLMHEATNTVRWGEHRGGMFVEVEGADAAGVARKRSWHLLAEGDDGPLIPSMAVAALVRRALDGDPPPVGARAGLHDLELDAYDRLFASRTIYTGVRDEPAPNAPLYARILGTAWDALPAEIRAMHDFTGAARGHASVERGTSWLARMAGRLMGFPAANADVPVQVQFTERDGTETWTRSFGSETFSSDQFAGRGRSEHLVCERFGPLIFAMALVVDGGTLRLVLRRWSAFGIPLPMWFCPRSNAHEHVEDGKFHFFVEISHPLAGLIVRYRGWLVRQ